MKTSVVECSVLFPRRRRTRPNWNQHYSEKEHEHPVPPLSQKSKPFASSSQASSTVGTASIVQPSASPTIGEKASLTSFPKKSIAIVIIAATCLIATFFLSTTHDSRIQIFDSVNRNQLALRRRLLPSQSSRRKKWDGRDTVTKRNEVERSRESLRYLSFGGPLTYGRGLSKSKRKLEAYPYLLPSSKSAHKNTVRNVAHPTYEISGPTLAAMCTQSIVEGDCNLEKLSNSYFTGEHHSGSAEYDVITLEYSYASTNTITTKETFLSSIKLLVGRLRQRYPLAKIVLVQLWTPSDLVYLDTTSNSTISYVEWRTKYEHKLQEQQLTPSRETKITEELLSPSFFDDVRLRDAIQRYDWTFAEQLETAREVDEYLESTMESEGGLVYKMPRPQSTKDILESLEEWFLEEWDQSEEEINDGFLFPHFVYTLSKEGHSIVARGIREILTSSNVVLNAHKRQRRTSSRFKHQQLNTWGSGDSCSFWYDAKESLPNSEFYSKEMYPSEIFPNLYALEVRASIGGTLKVRNPFDTSRMVYLTYLTTSEIASNKVYPKTKVQMVVEDPKAPQHRLPSPQTGQIRAEVFENPAATSVILDPSHLNISVSPMYHQQQHMTRTSAVGILPPFQTGILKFTTLEEYTIHPFRITGVSILAKRDTISDSGHFVPFEFAMYAPRRLSVTKPGESGDFDNDNEYIARN